MNLLITCHGNINRSPACAAVLKAEFPAYDVMGAGFVNPGNRAAKKMRDAMSARGYNLEEHRSQLITQQLVDWADHVVLMDGGNRRRYLDLFPEAEEKILMLGAYAHPAVTRIPDPNYMRRDSDEFQETVKLIVTASLNLGVRL